MQKKGFADPSENIFRNMLIKSKLDGNYSRLTKITNSFDSLLDKEAEVLKNFVNTNKVISM
jgi:hypothetical protein